MLGRDLYTAAIPAATLVDAGKYIGTTESGQVFMPPLNCISSGHC